MATPTDMAKKNNTVDGVLPTKLLVPPVVDEVEPNESKVVSASCTLVTVGWAKSEGHPDAHSTVTKLGVMDMDVGESWRWAVTDDHELR